MRTIILMRVSTDNQETLAQRSAIEEYIKKNNIVVDSRDWIEEKDISGFKVPIEEREGLNKIKEMAIKREFDQLVVFNLDRIGRQTEALPYISLLNQLGIKIISVTEGEIDGFNINNQLLTYIKLWQSQNESIKTSFRVKAGKQAKNERGGFNGGSPAYGYNYNKLTKELEINQEEAEVVKKIYNLYMSMGVTPIARKLEELEIKIRGNKSWSKATVASILKNPIYIGRQRFGYYVNNKRNKENIKLQPLNEKLIIIDDELWNKVQEIRCNRTTKRNSQTRDLSKSDVLFSGFIYHICEDGISRKLYVDYCYRKNGNKDLMYKCAHCKKNKSKSQKVYGGKSLEPIIEEAIMNEIDNLDLNNIRQMIEEYKNEDLKGINEKLSKCEVEVEKQHKLYNKAIEELEKIFIGESKLDTDVVNTMVNKAKNKIKELQYEKSQIEIEVANLESKVVNSDNLFKKYKNFRTIYENADIKDKKLILGELVDRIIIDRGNKIIIELNLL